jgi:hypothetical protein
MGRFSVVINGYEIRCETAADALELVRVAKVDSRTNGAPTVREAVPANAENRRYYEQALALLAAVRDSGESGIAGAKLWRIAGCNAPAGLGTAMQTVNRLLEEMGIEPGDVTKKRQFGGLKYRMPGPAIDEGITLLKAKMAELFPDS